MVAIFREIGYDWLDSRREGKIMVYICLLLFTGALQGMMVSLNGQLGSYYSVFGICFFVHGIAMVLLLAYLLVRRRPLRFTGAPWYVYLVGAMGIAMVSTSSWCTLHIGAAAMLALSTAGQLLSSKLIDQFGLFGVQKVKLRARQLPGYVLVIVGVALVVLQ